jgi:HD-GYP domain-containing protein (c-di-GMP phosphodiesterase class II)
MCYADIIRKRETLTKEEYNSIRTHPQRGYEILSAGHIAFSRSILEVVQQEHERLDGSGYPRRLHNGEINEFAQTVGLADTYEAMTHQRPYRAKFTPQETIREILQRKRLFSPALIKLLIEKVGVFPLGILVRLNTREIASVYKDNPKSPLRPVVNVIYDEFGNELETPKQIDLAFHSVVYIKECLKEEADKV